MRPKPSKLMPRQSSCMRNWETLRGWLTRISRLASSITTKKDELKANQAFTRALEPYPDEPKTRADRIAEIGGFYFDVFEEDHDKDNSIRALEWFAQAAEIYRTTGIKDLESSMYGSAANVYQKLAKVASEQEGIVLYRKAVEQLIRQADIYKTSDQRVRRIRAARVFSTIAKLYRDKLHDNTNALVFFNSALALYKLLGDSSGIGATQGDIQSLSGTGKPKPN